MVEGGGCGGVSVGLGVRGFDRGLECVVWMCVYRISMDGMGTVNDAGSACGAA